jgi:hypothetical protein
MKTVVVHSQQKWENMVVTRRTEITLVEELNVFGQQGWEVVSVLYYKDPKNIMAWSGFLKRPCKGSALPAVESGEVESDAIPPLSVESGGATGSTIARGIGATTSIAGTSSGPKEVKVSFSSEFDSEDTDFKVQEDS